MYKRPIYHIISERAQEQRRFIQALIGPRQTGKTTLARQVMEAFTGPCHYATADEPALKDLAWLEQQWEVGRTFVKRAGEHSPGLLIIDEVQKIPNWSETVKRLWDEDSAFYRPLHVIILGSSPLLVERGLSESLAGRFEVIPITHWSYDEMREAFGWDVNHYIYFGGYPGAATLISDYGRWKRYIHDSLIETTISRDILLMKRIDKPALLRRLFELGCTYSGQILSYQKMLGQLQDAGNTTTLAHYLQLLENAGLIACLSKYAGQKVRRRNSSPKLLVLNTALLSAMSYIDFEHAPKNFEFWGRSVESAVGASLANGIKGKDMQLFYWSGRNREVDFVLCYKGMITAIEVKSSRKKSNLPGIEAFSREFGTTRKLLIGGQGMPLEDFFLAPPEILAN